MALDFVWDAANLAHVAEHNLTAAEVEYALEHATLDAGYQDWHDEERFAEVGATQHGRRPIVITTWRGVQTRVVAADDAPKLLAEEYSSKR